MKNKSIVARVTLAAAIASLSACSQKDSAPASQSATIQTTANGDVALPAAGAIRFNVDSAGNKARYRVREQLMGKELPNDAIGETVLVSGYITLDSTSGALIPAQSKFTVGTSAFKSDSDRRDGYVRGRLLQTEQFPTVELVPKVAKGLPTGASAVSMAGPVTFDLIADLTIKGVTHPTTWRVTAKQAGGRVTGAASTKFTFADFGITPPKVPVVLSVADTIALEYDFALTRAPR